MSHPLWGRLQRLNLKNKNNYNKKSNGIFIMLPIDRTHEKKCFAYRYFFCIIKLGSGGIESIGVCPICGNPVVENEKGFGCTNWKNVCNFIIWRNDKFIEALGKKFTKEMVELLLKNGKVGFRNLKSKKGTTYSAYLKYVRDDKTGYYKWEM